MKRTVRKSWKTIFLLVLFTAFAVQSKAQTSASVDGLYVGDSNAKYMGEDHILDVRLYMKADNTFRMVSEMCQADGQIDDRTVSLRDIYEGQWKLEGKKNVVLIFKKANGKSVEATKEILKIDKKKLIPDGDHMPPLAKT